MRYNRIPNISLAANYNRQQQIKDAVCGRYTEAIIFMLYSSDGQTKPSQAWLLIHEPVEIDGNIHVLYIAIENLKQIWWHYICRQEQILHNIFQLWSVRVDLVIIIQMKCQYVTYWYRSSYIGLCKWNSIDQGAHLITVLVMLGCFRNLTDRGTMTLNEEVNLEVIVNNPSLVK